MFPVTEPEDYVNVMIGSYGSESIQRHHSSGNTLPLVARPWGFNHWAPQTTKDSTSWWFDAGADTFQGIRCTHQASPWIGDYGWFVLRPWLGYASDEFAGLTSYWASGALRPYLIDLTMGPKGVQAELTPTDHGAIFRVTFPDWVPEQNRRICAWVPLGNKNGEDEVRYKEAQGKLRATQLATGACQSENGGINLQSRRYAAGVPKETEYAFHARLEASELGVSVSGERDRQCCFTLPTHQHRIEIRIGTSFISAEQAQKALDDEVGTKSFDVVAAEGKEVWGELLGRIDVADAGPTSASTFRRLQIFYSSLYRALIYPRRLDEHTPDGVRHWSAYDGAVHEGPGVTDNGFWDTFRTVYQLLALAYPKELGEIIQGWLNAYKAGGWLPQWASPGYRGSMTGTFSDVIIADAILKNIPGFDHDTAWEALKKDSFSEVENPRDTTHGKQGLRQYLQYGFIPTDAGIEESCSRTLDIAYADAACAVVAERFGHATEAEDLRSRSRRALIELFDASEGLMGRKSSKGRFGRSAPEEWGSCFTEGSAWHHSFPSFNVSFLAELHGGPDRLLDKLKQVIMAPSDFKPGSYGKEIHEMREMMQVAIGQYAHNNQPVHHIPYLFSALGDHNATAALVRLVLARTYSPDGFIGDEDNGEMGAWYVLSALGLYATSVGTTDEYTLGAVPLFPRIHLKTLDVTIEAPSAYQDSPPIAGVLFRSKELPSTAISYAALATGGILRFTTPGDPRIGHIVSKIRGVVQQAVKSVNAEAAVVKKQLGLPTGNPKVPQPNSLRAAAGATGLVVLDRAGAVANRGLGGAAVLVAGGAGLAFLAQRICGLCFKGGPGVHSD